MLGFLASQFHVNCGSTSGFQPLTCMITIWEKQLRCKFLTWGSGFRPFVFMISYSKTSSGAMKANSSWHNKGLDSGPLRLWYSQATSGAIQIILTWGSGFRPFMFMILKKLLQVQFSFILIRGSGFRPIYVYDIQKSLRSNLVDPEKRVWIPAHLRLWYLKTPSGAI